MEVHSYKELDELQLDALKEIGSIGAGNAATALSSMIGKSVRIDSPQVRIMEYNEAIEWMGGPELITAGVLVKMSGQLKGILLSLQQMEFVDLICEALLGHGADDYSQLGPLEHSALTEVGNIMINAYITALCGLTGMDAKLTVPDFCVDMQGAIIAVPLAEYGGQSDYLMTIGGDFILNGKKMPCRLLLSPELNSLNTLMRKLGL